MVIRDLDQFSGSSTVVIRRRRGIYVDIQVSARDKSESKRVGKGLFSSLFGVGVFDETIRTTTPRNKQRNIDATNLIPFPKDRD
ncbi:MAG: hypothetical protein AB7R90_17850 [Reyranellaceae bacterium]